VPGERVNFRIMIDNKSSRDINEMSVKVLQRIKIHGSNFAYGTASKEINRVVAELNFDKKISPSSIEEINSFIKLPPVCSTSNGLCKLIGISYSVDFNFEALGGSVSKDLTIPITIGTQPLTTSESNGEPKPEDSLLDSVQYKTITQLIYQACPFGPNSCILPKYKGDIIQSDASSYRPFYPYYQDTQNSN
jgi:hypothetical protein